ncbi:MAG: amidohydrolase family protein [Myxococcales bacterium]|nr:amidohydrolase family protein [Myxococcales bacterium]
MRRVAVVLLVAAVAVGAGVVAMRVARPPVEPPTMLRTVVNVHEHIESVNEAEKLLEAMDRAGIALTALMGSSRFTITENQGDGFTQFEENNREILEIARRWPDRFQAWPTIDPTDPEKLAKLKGYVAEGAKGLKLYIGHGLHDLRPGASGYFFHTRALDDPGMMEVFAYCQETRLPVMLHVNPGPTAPGFADELLAVLRAFPDMKVIAPHFVLSSIRSSRLRALLDAFPNVYSDVSFGHDDFLGAGLKRISRSPKKFRELFADYPTRFMFGTDVVVTAYAGKSVPWMAARFRAYLDMLSKETYETEAVPGKTLRGLALPPELLEGVLWRNFERFSALAPSGTGARPGFGVIEWKAMGIPKVERAPGTMLPRDAWDGWRKEQAAREAARRRAAAEKAAGEKAAGEKAGEGKP